MSDNRTDQLGTDNTDITDNATLQVNMTLGATSLPCDVTYVDSRPGFYMVSYPATVSGLYQVALHPKP